MQKKNLKYFNVSHRVLYSCITHVMSRCWGHLRATYQKNPAKPISDAILRVNFSYVLILIQRVVVILF